MMMMIMIMIMMLLPPPLLLLLPFQIPWMKGERGFKLASCTVSFVQWDKLTLLQSVSLSRILLSKTGGHRPGGRRPLRPS